MEDVRHSVGEGVRPVGEGDWKRGDDGALCKVAGLVTQLEKDRQRFNLKYATRLGR
jgi:hypothetical protein